MNRSFVAGSGERDYSHRSLMEKLGVKAPQRAALVGRHDDAFVAQLDVRLSEPASRALRANCDVIFLRVDSPRDLARVAAAARRLVPNGALWIFHPKGRGADPNDGQVRAAGLGAGLVDNKIWCIPIRIRRRASSFHDRGVQRNLSGEA